MGKGVTESDLFKGLNEEQRNVAMKSGACKAIKPNSVLFHQGDPATGCYMVLQGRLKLTMLNESGKETTIRYIGVGELTAAVSLLRDREYPATAYALEKTEIVMWGRSGLLGLMERFPIISINMVHIVLVRLDDLQQRYLELSTEQVEQRIARTLLRFMNRTGSKTADGIRINIPLSRQTIADYIGTSMFTVSRTLSKWEKKGIVRSGREMIIVTNPHALVTVAENS